MCRVFQDAQPEKRHSVRINTKYINQLHHSTCHRIASIKISAIAVWPKFTITQRATLPVRTHRAIDPICSTGERSLFSIFNYIWVVIACNLCGWFSCFELCAKCHQHVQRCSTQTYMPKANTEFIVDISKPRIDIIGQMQSFICMLTHNITAFGVSQVKPSHDFVVLSFIQASG